MDEERSNAELLKDFVGGDEGAFAEVVRRHGPMVYGVCSRVLRSRHDAEDAFQATFLVLARRPSIIQPAEHVARWLYGTARRIALKARQQRERRRVVESLASGQKEPPPEIPSNLWEILDEEVARLPAKLLSPFLLCDLEGLTYRDAARQLGLPEATLSNRLASARRKLADWLTRRGIIIPAAGLVFTPSTAFSHELAESTVDAAMTPGYLTPLSKGALQAMTITKTAKVLTVLALVFGLSGWLFARAEDKELKKLEGEWTVVSAERSGVPLPVDDLKKMKVIISGSTMTIDSGTRQEVSTLMVDPTTSPWSIDLTTKKNNGQKELGIYELKGDELKICWGGEAVAGGRTTEFKTTKAGGGRLIVLKKVGAKG